MTDEKYSKANFTGIERQEDAPVGEAVAMMVREKLTGQRPPASAGKVLDLWRDFIEDKAGSELDDLSSAINDQQAFAKVIRNMLSAMEMAEDTATMTATPTMTTSRSRKTSRAATNRTRTRSTRMPAPMPPPSRTARSPTSRWRTARPKAPKSPTTT